MPHFAILLLAAALAARLDSAVSIAAPPEAIRVAVENVDGALLIRASLFKSERVDTVGTLVLDTGAGYLALAPALIQWLGLSDEPVEQLTFAPRPLRRLQVGDFQQDVVGPILGVDVDVIEQATDRKVLGLLGQQPLGSFAVRIDYRSDSLALIPMKRDGIAATLPRRMMAPDMAAADAATMMARNASREALGAALTADAICLPFQLEGDGKILLRTQLSDSKSGLTGDVLTLVLDTGATKTVIFEKQLAAVRGGAAWKEMRGLSAPTLYGTETAYMSRVPSLTVTGGGARATARDMDVAVMNSPLEAALSQAVHQQVDGLLGYSFLRRFRTTIDYPHRVLWLEPIPVSRDQRVFEYSHVGIQVERHAGALRVAAVAEGSPAARAGVRPGDEILAIDGSEAGTLDVASMSRKLEGPPGSRVTLRTKRGVAERGYRLTRRRLL